MNGRKTDRSAYALWGDAHKQPFETVKADEEAFRKMRRNALNEAGVEQSSCVTGIALSGGGIRSATFSLGILRELAALKLLHKFDYLSTVSGGSYVGAYYASLFAGRKSDSVLSAESFKNGKDPFSDPEGLPKASLDYLRQHGRYLAPSGAGDYWNAVGLMVRNWIGVHIVIGSAVALLALFAVAFRLSLYQFVANAGFVPRVPALLLQAPLLILLVVPIGLHVMIGWAYWLTKRDSSNGPFSLGVTFATGGTFIIMICSGLLIMWPALRTDIFGSGANPLYAAWVIGFFATSGLVIVVTVFAHARSTNQSSLHKWDHVRSLITQPMRFCASATAVILAAAFVDWLSYIGYTEGYLGSAAFQWPPLIATIVVPIGQWLLKRIMALGETHPQGAVAARFLSPDLLLKIGAIIAASLLTITVAVTWTFFAYWATWPTTVTGLGLSSGCPAWQQTIIVAKPWDGCTTLPETTHMWRSLIAFLVMFAFLSICIARTPAFLNLSSLCNFYAVRLRRAYLGASNVWRLGGGPSGATNEEHHPALAPDHSEQNDDVPLAQYREISAAGGPLHLINITLNETRGEGSNLVQRDRRGRNLVLSPAGLYCDADGSRHVYRLPYDEEEHEQLPLSTWIAISGAAFSTGIGSRSGFPISTLAGLANVRLGYWWKAQKLVSRFTQRDLFDELRGIFRGPSGKVWYLSDGGHFENTGVYELIRRKVPLIVVCDNGMDERFEYEDMANLARKARIDFGCEINFLPAQDLDRIFPAGSEQRRAFGALHEITTGTEKSGAERAVAALARLDYGDVVGTMLLIKPRLTGDGPQDLIRYKAANSAFPQQSTMDQFFDEAQFESYYHLGRLIAQSIFTPTNERGVGYWVPSALKPIPS